MVDRIANTIIVRGFNLTGMVIYIGESNRKSRMNNFLPVTETPSGSTIALRRWQNRSVAVCFHCGQGRSYAAPLGRHLSTCPNNPRRRSTVARPAPTSVDLDRLMRQQASQRYAVPNINPNAEPWFPPPNYHPSIPGPSSFVESSFTTPSLAYTPVFSVLGQQITQTTDTSSHAMSEAEAPQPIPAQTYQSTTDNFSALFGFDELFAPQEDGTQYWVNPIQHGINNMTQPTTGLETRDDIGLYNVVHETLNTEGETQSGSRSWDPSLYSPQRRQHRWNG